MRTPPKPAISIRNILATANPITASPALRIRSERRASDWWNSAAPTHQQGNGIKPGLGDPIDLIHSTCALPDMKKEANAAFDFFVETYGVKYEKAVAKLVKGRAGLLAFHDFPTEHWMHIRTTNPGESVFAAVRNRSCKTKGCLYRKTALAMVFRLMMSARKKWRKISGPSRLPDIIQGVVLSKGLCSKTASGKFKPPPDKGRHQLLGIVQELAE